MATSEKTVLLEKILAQHKVKTKKNYLQWEVLRKDLGATGRKKFGGLTAKSSWPELKNVIEPFLGDHLALFEIYGDYYLAVEDTTPEELRAEIDSEIAKIVEAKARIAAEKAKIKDEKAKITAAEKARKAEEKAKIEAEKKAKVAEEKAKLDVKKSQVLKNLLGKVKYVQLELNQEEQTLFGIKKTQKGPTASALEKAISPFLGSELMSLKKKMGRKEIIYLAKKMPLQELVNESCRAQGAKEFSPEKIADDVPIDKKKLADVFSQLLSAGQLQVTKIDEKFGITGLKIPTPSDSHESHPSQLTTRNSQLDDELFHATFERLRQGRFYVRICKMRRELGWSEERFNALLRKLRADGTIHLHAGDVSTMSEEDANQSYTDENNFFYVNLTWKEK